MSEDEVARLRTLVAEGIEAFRLTREYVGEDTLYAGPGWSWFEWTEKARAALSGVPEGAASDPMKVTHRCPACGRPTHTVDGPVPSPEPLPSWQSVAAILHEIATIDGCDENEEGHDEAHEDEAKVMLNIIRHASGVPEGAASDLSSFAYIDRDRAVPSPEPLDVERLHSAMTKVLHGTYGTQWAEDERREVEQIVAEYARLAAPQPVPEDAT